MPETNRSNTCLSQKPHFYPPSSSALPSPNSISAVRRDRWQIVGLAGSSPSPLSYFHKPIIADHLGRLRPCLSPSQPGRRGGGAGSGAPRCSTAGTATRAGTRLPWERAAGAKRYRAWVRGVGAAGRAHGCTHLHPGEGAGCRARPSPQPEFQGSRRLSCPQPCGANEMQMTAEGRASENAGPAVRNLKGAFTASPRPQAGTPEGGPRPSEARERI